jgi:uncharacterized membrane protein YgaE (UPF0421/DUF939 family)
MDISREGTYHLKLGLFKPGCTSVIIGVFLGGIVTYCFNISLDRNRRQFELKKETYFEALDTILKMQRISIETQQFLKAETTDSYMLNRVSITRLLRANLPISACKTH